MKAEDLYRKEFGDADSVPKESVIRLLKHFAKVLKMEREQSKQLVCPDCADGRDEYAPEWECPKCRYKDYAN